MKQRRLAARGRGPRHVRLALVILTVAAITASCGSATPGATATPGPAATPAFSIAAATPTPAPPAVAGVITLVAPAAGAVVTQNDPSLATKCPANATRGLGYVIEFSWKAVGLANVAGFQVVMQHGSGTPIVLDVDGSTTTSLSALSCNTFVIDNNLTGWHWQVNALNNGKQVVVSSQQRAFTFGPCRLANGTPCNAS